jgi:hypothetical protein
MRQPKNGWSRAFDDPIPLPDGGELRTLRDATDFITRLPKREHGTEAWQTATQALLLVAEHVGDPMLPRIAVMQALHRGFPVNLWWYLLVWFSFFPREAAGAPKHPAFPAPSTEGTNS